MLLFLCALILSSIIVGTSIALKSSSLDKDIVTNEELEKFYGMFSEPLNAQLHQLVLAGKTLLRNFAKISKDKDTIWNLYNERVISEKFYKKHKMIEEELIIEKSLIETEADSLRPGSKEGVFQEAGKLLSSENSGYQRTKLFDEAAFLKRQDLLRQNIKENSK